MSWWAQILLVLASVYIVLGVLVAVTAFAQNDHLHDDPVKAVLWFVWIVLTWFVWAVFIWHEAWRESRTRL